MKKEGEEYGGDKRNEQNRHKEFFTGIWMYAFYAEKSGKSTWRRLRRKLWRRMRQE